ncbi:ADP-ribosylglycohydrolase family protein [Vagococcus fluvialis]|uniref:ADP-ribosylglycohydrolase n=1 Tax=Vagococcus fluvialis TaxID=2738 RepID=A0A7X6D8C1_9ENTE|nr:ADP-ribosylglycohydrolase family protein [Vagococcus fluvialis]NKC67664.1 ADP-ribosylglycohydrolase [Vagococcus fluvialis]
MNQNVWGVLVGGALGDAFGMPTECWTQEKIRTIFPNGVTELIASHPSDTFGRKMVAGSITDDTINVLMILKMIDKNQGQIRVEDYIAELVDWNNNSGVSEFVSGPSTLKALSQIEKGVPIEKTGISGTTNGASMKIAPIGIVMDYLQMEELVETVHQICLPTHNAKVAIQGASAVAAAISYVVRGGNSIGKIWDVAYEAIAVAKNYGFDFPSASLVFRMEQTQKILREESEETVILERLYNEIGSGMETLQTIPCSFAIVELAKGNPVKAAQLSAMIGWDTDTIGAISAAICGGMNPEIPENLVEIIEQANKLDFEELTRNVERYIR